ncbi:dTMP kinase [archaeon SCG-AAA382B04]|nr:dTMP kinase [archaeon SCG-AAA382B04]
MKNIKILTLLMKGKIITIEGIDGSGKSTITEALVEKLNRKLERKIIKTKEPTDSWLGNSVRKGLRKNIDPLAEAFLFTADHIEHIEKEIKPHLDKKRIVISDRYSDSFYAYQGATLAQNRSIKNPIKYLKNLRKDFTIKPDLTIFLDVSPRTAMERLGEDKIKFENLEFQKKVYENFERIIEEERDRFLVVDGEKAKDDVINQIMDSIELKINF